MKTYEELYDAEAVKQMEDAGLNVPLKEQMTCNGCQDASVCEFAWDPYNTDGDCLASK